MDHDVKARAGNSGPAENLREGAAGTRFKTVLAHAINANGRTAGFWISCKIAGMIRVRGDSGDGDRAP